MKTTFFYKNLNKKEEAAFSDYAQSKKGSIESLLTKFEDDAGILRLSIEKFDKHDAYQVEFRLDLYDKPIIATESSHQIGKAVDLAKDRLITQIKKHLSQLRNNRGHRGIKKGEKVLIEEKINIEV